MGFWTSKPPAGTQLMRGHSIRPRHAYLFNEGAGNSIRDYGAGRHGTSTGGVRASYARGQTWRFTATSNNVDLGDPILTIPLTNVTFVFGYRKTDATLRDSSAFGSTNSGGGIIEAILPYTDGSVYWDWAGQTAGTSRLVVAGLTFGDDIWAFTVGARGMEVWQNGIRRGSNAGNSVQSVTGGNFKLGVGSGRTADLAEFAFFYIYHSQLSAGQITSLAFDPYQMWAPPVWRQYFTTPAVVAAPLVRSPYVVNQAVNRSATY